MAASSFCPFLDSGLLNSPSCLFLAGAQMLLLWRNGSVSKENHCSTLHAVATCSRSLEHGLSSHASKLFAGEILCSQQSGGKNPRIEFHWIDLGYLLFLNPSLRPGEIDALINWTHGIGVGQGWFHRENNGLCYKKRRSGFWGGNSLILHVAASLNCPGWWALITATGL